MENSFVISSENEAITSEREAIFILDQAEKQLKETVETSNLILNRSVVILTISSGFLVSTIGFLITTYQNKFELDTLMVASLLVISYLLYFLYKLRGNIKGYEYQTVGARPQYLLHDGYFNAYKEEKNRLVAQIITIIKAHQIGIEKNKTTNVGRWEIYDECLNLLFALPAYIVIVFLLCLGVGF